MDCDECFDAAVTRKDKLTPAEKAAVEDHVKGCEECARFIRASAAYDKAMADPASAPPVPQGMKDRVLEAARIMADVQDVERTFARRRRWVVTAALAACLAVGFVVGHFVGHATPAPAPAFDEVAGEKILETAKDQIARAVATGDRKLDEEAIATLRALETLAGTSPLAARAHDEAAKAEQKLPSLLGGPDLGHH